MRIVTCAVLVLLAGLPAAAEDPRTVELLRRDCASTLGANDTTLFANGTVRWRDSREGTQSLSLAELEPERVAGFLARLRAIDLGETSPDRRAVDGAWVDWCEIHLQLPDRAPLRFRYGGLDTRTLALDALIRIVDELATIARSAGTAGELPSGYEPRIGDRLARSDGAEFDVVGFTVDGLGVELRGRIEPLSIYVPRADLRLHFVRLVARSSGR